MEQTAAAGAMLAVHAEDDDTVMHSYEKLQHARSPMKPSADGPTWPPS